MLKADVKVTIRVYDHRGKHAAELPEIPGVKVSVQKRKKAGK